MNGAAPFALQACGCPVEGFHYPYKCDEHAGMDGRVRMPDLRRDNWYVYNTCHYCGRGTPAGLACDRASVCDLCGVRSCARHDVAVYWLGIICPKRVNPRTKDGKALLASLRIFLAPNGLKSSRCTNT